MSAQNPTPAGGPALVGPPDPEHDPRASYALEPAYVRALTDRLVATRDATADVRRRSTGAARHIPQSTPADVDEAFRRARAAQEAWARTRSTSAPALLLRLHDLLLDRQAEIVDLICWESGKARKDAYDEPLHVALTARYYGRTATGTSTPSGAPASCRA